MASPRLAALKSLSPRPLENLLNVRRSLSPRTPENKSGNKLKIEHPKSAQRNRFSPFKVDTPNRAKILNDGLPDKEHDVLGSGCFGTVYKASYRGDDIACTVSARRGAPQRAGTVLAASGIKTPCRHNIVTCGHTCLHCVGTARRILRHAFLPGRYSLLSSTQRKLRIKCDQVAAKIVRRRKCSDAAVDAERHAAFLRHSNIVRVLAIEQGAVWSMITMELCGTSLQDRLDRTGLSRDERLATWRAIASALQFCHRAGIIHADVKPKNVLIGNDGQPKLADFGSSVIVDEPRFSTGLHGTPGYAAPEVIRGKSPSSYSDIYSLGVLAWQLLYREAPFAGLHSHTILYLTGKGARPVEHLLDDGFHGEYKSLYKKLWSESTNDRPTLTLILDKLDELKDCT